MIVGESKPYASATQTASRPANSRAAAWSAAARGSAAYAKGVDSSISSGPSMNRRLTERSLKSRSEASIGQLPVPHWFLWVEGGEVAPGRTLEFTFS